MLHTVESHRPSGVHRTFLVLVLALTIIPAWKLFATLPQQTVVIQQVIPAEARPGDSVTLTGYALDSAHVQELYLISEEDTPYKAEILSLSGKALRFRVPLKIGNGLMRIAVKAPGIAGVVDQMVYLKVLDSVG